MKILIYTNLLFAQNSEILIVKAGPVRSPRQTHQPPPVANRLQAGHPPTPPFSVRSPSPSSPPYSPSSPPASTPPPTPSPTPTPLIPATTFPFSNFQTLPDAIGIADRPILLEPEEKEWPLLRALLVLYSGDVEAAVSLFEDAVAAEPLRVEAYLGLAMAASQLEPDKWEVWMERTSSVVGEYLHRRGKGVEAVSMAGDCPGFGEEDGGGREAV